MSLYKQSESTSARRWILFRCFDDDSGDGYAPKTGLTFANGELKIAKPGAADANATGYASVVEAGHGRYWYPASAAELDTLGVCSLVVNKTDVYAADAEFQVVPFDPYNAVSLGLSNLDATVSSRLASADYEDLATMLAAADTIETGLPLGDAIRFMVAVLAGVTGGAGTGTETYRAALANHKVRVTTTVVGNNRTVVAFDAT